MILEHTIEVFSMLFAASVGLYMSSMRSSALGGWQVIPTYELSHRTLASEFIQMEIDGIFAHAR